MTEQALQTQTNPLNYSREQLDLIKRTFATGCTDDEFQLFMLTAERMGLRPEFKQIHVVKRKAKDNDGNWIEKISIQTGIDGYRAIADRTGRYAPGREPKFEYDAKDNLKAATAYVKKLVAGDWHEVAATAHMDEYAQTYTKNGERKMTAMWADKPHIMLSKCAEALCLRRAFPAELSGVYTDEEMQQADTVRHDVIEAETVVQKPAAKPAQPAAPAPEAKRPLTAPELSAYITEKGQNFTIANWHTVNAKAVELAMSLGHIALAEAHEVPSDVMSKIEIETQTKLILDTILGRIPEPA